MEMLHVWYASGLLMEMLHAWYASGLLMEMLYLVDGVEMLRGGPLW